MKTRILTLFLVLISSVAFSQNRYTPHYKSLYDPGLFDDDMTMITEVSIEGVVQNVNYLEIGVFCGDEVRGYGMLEDYQKVNYVAFVQLVGFASQHETLTFRLWNHETNSELDFICTNEVAVVSDATFGTIDNPYRLYFVTPATCTFTNVDGNNWSTATNWSPRIPASCDDAIIAANSICVIDEDATVAYKTLTIKDGAQFVGDGEEYEVTFEKEIAAYTPGTRNNYYFIANPTDGEFLETENLLEGNFDLYFWDASGYDEEEEEIKEWQNYKSEVYADPSDFESEDGGYLYGNAQNVVLKFNGIANSEEEFTTGNLAYNGESENFPGLHLIGNPLTTNANVTGGASINGFFTLNEHRNEVEPIENPVVGPCSALFANCYASGSGNKRKVTFTSDIEGTVNTRSLTSLINIEVSNNDNLLDRAYVRFNEQDNLQKFTLNPEATHIFFREEGKDYAIVKGNERMSQLPLYFETREYGVYTINVKLENMNCEYLHLIDNMTGADIDLNATPSYTFRANQGDYASRFKLVFEGTGVEENSAIENFAIVEGNRVIIPMIEHESQLEIIDLTGRVISSQKVNGSFDQTLNVNAGIYLLRMNGNVQKIVVR